MAWIYFLSYEWISPDDSGKEWLEIGAPAPIDSGQKIYDACVDISRARPDQAKITPLNLILLKAGDPPE